VRVSLIRKPICLAESRPSSSLSFEMDIVCCPKVTSKAKIEAKVTIAVILDVAGRDQACVASMGTCRRRMRSSPHVRDGLRLPLRSSQSPFATGNHTLSRSALSTVSVTEIPFLPSPLPSGGSISNPTGTFVQQHLPHYCLSPSTPSIHTPGSLPEASVSLDTYFYLRVNHCHVGLVRRRRRSKEGCP
jgi:hypothetical protein